MRLARLDTQLRAVMMGLIYAELCDRLGKPEVFARRV
jgi:hypothetical protein